MGSGGETRGGDDRAREGSEGGGRREEEEERGRGEMSQGELPAETRKKGMKWREGVLENRATRERTAGRVGKEAAAPPSASSAPPQAPPSFDRTFHLQGVRVQLSLHR